MSGAPVLQDLEWDGAASASASASGDDESFKSAVESSLAQSFLTYSSTRACNRNPNYPLPRDISTSSHSDFFVDALSEEDDEEWETTSTRGGSTSNEQELLRCTLPDDNDEGVDTVDVDRVEENINIGEEAKPSQKREITGVSPEGGEESTTTQSQSQSQSQSPGIPQNSSSETAASNNTIKRKEEIKSFAFNQDRDCIVVATSLGYQIQTLDTDPNKPYQIHKVNIAGGGVSYVQILHRTSLLVMVKNKTPRTLSIVHAKTAQLVRELSFTDAIRRVEMNKSSLVILTANGELHCFIFRNGDLEFVQNVMILHAETESPRMITADVAATQGAFFELASRCHNGGKGMSWLVTKSADGIGSISLYRMCAAAAAATAAATGNRDSSSSEGSCMELVKTFSAHNHGITRVAIAATSSESDEGKFATASVQGTIIRVFSIPHCHHLYELQRGSSSAIIYSLSFNFNTTVLAASSSKGTMHLFHLCEDNQFQKDDVVAGESEEHKNSSSFISKLNPFRPKSKNSGQKQKPIRSFAKIWIKDVKPRILHSVTLMKASDDSTCCHDHLLICYANGKFFQFQIEAGEKRSRPIRVDHLIKS